MDQEDAIEIMFSESFIEKNGEPVTLESSKDENGADRMKRIRPGQ